MIGIRARNLRKSSVYREHLSSGVTCLFTAVCTAIHILLSMAIFVFILYSRTNTAFDDDRLYKLHFHNRSSPTPCYQPAFLLTVINSYPTHLDRRNSIRKSWGNGSEYNERLDYAYAWRTLFVIGRTGKKKIDERIEAEAKAYGDVILGEFKDSMKNLTYKTILGMQWAYRNCKPMYFFKCDDDIFVNAPFLFDTVRELALTRYNDDVWICRSSHSLQSRRVVRDRRNKYFVSYHEYAYTHFPKFCSGFAYIMSGSIVKKMIDAIIKVPIIHTVDDAYIALLGKEKNIVPQHDNRFHVYHPPMPHHNYTKGEIQSRLAEHQIHPKDQVKMLIVAKRAWTNFSETAQSDPPFEKSSLYKCRSRPIHVDSK